MSESYDEKLNEWVRNIREGDRHAFEKLFLEFYEALSKFAWRYVRSSHISEELVQEVFLEVWKTRDEMDPNKNIKAFLYQSVRNKALNHVKHQEIAEEHNSNIEWLNPDPATQIHALDEKSKFEKAAKKAIEDLPDGARKIYKLSRKDGLTYREISEVLEISPKTVESQMSRALKILRQSLSKYLPTIFISFFSNVV